MANLYIEYFETKTPPLCLRYIDDCFVIWPYDRDFGTFLQELNDALLSLKFSVEYEQNGSIPFLDAKVTRNGTEFLFNIYRKPTHSNAYIHWFSNHSRNTKRGSLFGLFLRAYRICDEPFIDNEINYIKSSFLKLGYPLHFITKVLGDVRRKYYSQAQTSRDGPQPPTISLPHNGFTEKYIKPVFKSQGIRVVNKATNTLGAALFNKRCSPNAPISPQAGVYVIPCNDCNRHYVGQTGQFRIRADTHRRNLAHGTGGEAPVAHVQATGHIMNVANIKVVYPTKIYRRRQIVESALIRYLPNINLVAGDVKELNSYTCQLLYETNGTMKRILSGNPG